MLSSSTYCSQGKVIAFPCLVILIVMTLAPCCEADAQVTTEELSQEPPARTDEVRSAPSPLGLVLGLRTGAAFATQRVLKNTGNGTSIGPLVNGEVLYALREWMRIGMMLEWHQHSINLHGPKLGTLGVFSILPTVEFRPDRGTRERLGWESFVNEELSLKSLIPYVSLGLGANAQSFSNSDEVAVKAESFSTTFALRVATGFDIAIDSKWSFNTEVAWNRDSGTYNFNGQKADFKASTLNLLVGIRRQF